jgi:hypothetical protein
MPGSRGSSRGRGGVDGGDVCALGNTRAALARGVLISLGLRETSGGVVAWGSGVTSLRVTSGVATLGAISGKVALGGASGVTARGGSAVATVLAGGSIEAALRGGSGVSASDLTDTGAGRT